jgi:N-acetylglucosamine-6-phosphate deacetylase
MNAAPFDLQLNGFAGVDFGADDLTAADLVAACAAVRAAGGGAFLATVITDRFDRLEARIARIAAAWEAEPTIRESVPGIHVEGPFIRSDPGYVGAHPPEHVRPATVDDAAKLVAAGRGLVRLVTLAPECDAGAETTAWLADRGILVAAGHCDPSADELRRATAAGLSLFTHLGNGCPHVLPRHDNIIQRAIACDGLRWITVIPDGVHVPAMALGNYLKAMGLERAVAVTDATAAGGMGPGRYRLGPKEVVVGEDGAAWSADRTHLVGSTASMGQVRRFLAEDLGLAAADVERLTSLNPREALAGAGRWPVRGAASIQDASV